MNIIYKKLTTISCIFLFIIFLSGCTNSQTLKDSGKIFLVESSPNKSSARLIQMNESLKTVNTTDLKVKSAAQGFSDVSQDKKNIYITTAQNKVTDKETSNILISFDKSSNKVNNITLPENLADTVGNNENFIYNTYNWGGICTISSINKTDKKLKTTEISKRGVCDLILTTENELFLTCMELNENKTKLYILNPESLKILDSITFGEDASGNYINGIVTKDKVYLSGCDLVGKGILVIYDKNQKNYSSISLDSKVRGMFLKDNIIKLICCNDSEDKKSTIYEYNLNKNNIKEIKTLDHRVLDTDMLNGNYVFLSRNEIWIYNNRFEKIKHEKLQDDFNLELIVSNN